MTAVDLSNWSSAGVATTVATTGAYAFSGLAPGRYALRFDVPPTSGLVGEWYNDKTGRFSADAVELISGVSRTGVDVALSLPASISGTVTVPTGVSASGISVTAYDPANGWASSATTDAAGRYTISGLTASSYRLSFAAPESAGLVSEWYADKSDFSTATAVTVASGQKRANVDATLAKGASLSGRVIVPAGVSIAPYTFRVVAYDAQQRWVGSTFVAADGTFTLSGLTAGTYRLQVDAPSESGLMDEWYADAADFASARALTVAAGEARTGLDVTLGTGASISGRVTLPTDLAAEMTNVRVQVSTDDYRNSGSASVSSTGDYTVGGLAPGTYRVQFVPGYGSTLSPEWWDDKSDRESATAIEVAAGAKKTAVDATLARGASVSGTISAPPGQSVSGVQVYAYTTSEYSYAAWASVGADGAYRLVGLRPGTYRLKFAPAQGSALMSEWYNDKGSFASADGLTVAAGDVRDRIDASLDIGGSISGTVTVPSGMTLGSGPSAIRVSASAASGVSSYASATVGLDGRYTITGLTSGTYRVFFDAPSGSGLVDEYYDDAPDYNSSALVEVKRGTTSTGVDAALTAGTSISGRVTLPAGTMVDSMQYRVSAYGDDYSYAGGSQINNDGSYSLTDLRPGTYRLQFSAPESSGVLSEWYSDKREYWTADGVSVTVDSPRTDVNVELSKAASFSGRVITDTGAAVAGATVVASRRVGTTWQRSDSVLTDAQGAYTLSGLQAGTFSLQFVPPTSTGLLQEWWRDARDQATATPLTLSSGQTMAGLVATMDRGATAAGTVRYSGGDAVSGVDVLVLDRTGTELGRSTTDAAGRYKITGLPAVAATIGAVSAGGTVLEGGAATLAGAPVRTLTLGATTSVDLSLAGRTVSGVVRIAGSTTPLAAGTVTLSSVENADGFSTAVGADGRYRFVSVPAGTYVARVASSDQAYATTWSDAAASAEEARYFRVSSSDFTKNLTIFGSATLSGTTDASAGGYSWVNLLRWNGTDFVYTAGTSAAAGTRFAFAGLAPGQYTVRVGDVYQGGQIDPSRATRIELSAGVSTDIGVFQSTAADGGALRGAISGSARGVRVYATDASGAERSVTATMVDGVLGYEFPSLPQGSYIVRAEARGFPVAWFGGSTRASATRLPVTTGGTARADLAVEAGTASLSGNVTRGGAALAGATVNLVEIGPGGTTYGGAYAVTAADGSYRFANLLVPGRPYRVSIQGGPEFSSTEAVFSSVAGSQRRDLATSIPGELNGAVVDESTGAPVANAPVQAFRDGSTEATASARTDSAGRYSFTALAPGAYRVQFGLWSGDGGGLQPVPSANAPEWLPDATTASAATPVRVSAAVTAQAPTLKVGLAGVVTGRVVKRVALGELQWFDDAMITLLDAQGATVVTDYPRYGEAPGAYSVAVAPGTYTVCAQPSPWSTVPKTYVRSCAGQKVVVRAATRATATNITLHPRGAGQSSTAAPSARAGAPESSASAVPPESPTAPAAQPSTQPSAQADAAARASGQADTVAPVAGASAPTIAGDHSSAPVASAARADATTQTGTPAAAAPADPAAPSALALGLISPAEWAARGWRLFDGAQKAGSDSRR